MNFCCDTGIMQEWLDADDADKADRRRYISVGKKEF